MKQLLLIRHAEAAHPTGTSDFDRPLTARGRQCAQELAEKLKAARMCPELLIMSPATRTESTAQIVISGTGIAKAEKIEAIYEASTKTILGLINSLPDQHQFIALVGHNPAFTDIAVYLTGKYVSLSPAAAILILFEEDRWEEITKESGVRAWFYEPAD
ncbi:histidine phosphatase family protein [Mucilaginibacter sp. RS28]|uniref:Histidine phosphatase family protein n=1 Tax=Mucilaginibacter straminoryzae TaxID=2932774 RepID=A0A9X1X793_9SPHI|nr:histidine phosphatase family protein [Mucilaginibacter straminoryzae]MCJ8209959.1 histidine phosphatase family protein [Mucilaginibacter straminoryzae]